jgi:hypothetical protein
LFKTLTQKGTLALRDRSILRNEHKITWASSVGNTVKLEN